MEEVLMQQRELIDGVYHTVHVSRDGSVRIMGGRDDQRPDADGVKWFLPWCVAQLLLHSDSVYSYHYYCGSCRKRMGLMADAKQFCPRCGSGIAHSTFSMGVVKWRPSGYSSGMPDELPLNAAPESAYARMIE